MDCFIEKFTVFHRIWKQVFETDAKVYTGLYSGISRVADGTAKKPEKILKEWCIRTDNKFNSSKANGICLKQIKPLIDNDDKKQFRKVAKRLLKAANSAGVLSSELKELILNENTAKAYINLNDCELFEGDSVKVISPAWFQNGELIEQGYCNKE